MFFNGNAFSRLCSFGYSAHIFCVFWVFTIYEDAAEFNSRLHNFVSVYFCEMTPLDVSASIA